MTPNCALKKAGPDTAQAETSFPACPAQGSGGGRDTVDLNRLPGAPPAPPRPVLVSNISVILPGCRVQRVTL